MSTQINKEITQQIFDLCKLYNEYEKFIENVSSSPNENFEYIGYLIENDLIKKWKISIFYEDFKNNLSIGYKFLETSIDRKCKKNRYNKMLITQTKFENAQNLKDDLFNNKEYKLITDQLWKRICKPNARNENGIKYKITKKTISLIFNEKEKLDFKINNFIISRETLNENENVLNISKEEKNGDDKKNINNENTKIVNQNKNDLSENNNTPE